MGLTLSQLVWAYEEADLEQLVKTNICERCNLSSADLNNLDLKNANLNSADLSYADFSGSDLSGANLIGAYLYQTKLVGVDLTSANMAGSKLSGVNLTDANLQSANINLGELQRGRSESRKPTIIIQPEGDYPEITSFDLNGNSKYMTSKSGSCTNRTTRNLPDMLTMYGATQICLQPIRTVLA